MHRRGFIGSVLGLVSGVPFLVEAVEPEIQDFSHGDKMHIFGDLFNKKDLHNFGFYLFTNGERYKGPEVDFVKIEELTTEMKATIYAKELKIKTPIQYEGLGVTWKRKKVVERKFFSSVSVAVGDTIRLDYSLSTGKLLCSVQLFLLN